MAARPLSLMMWFAVVGSGLLASLEMRIRVLRCNPAPVEANVSVERSSLCYTSPLCGQRQAEALLIIMISVAHKPLAHLVTISGVMGRSQHLNIVIANFYLIPVARLE